MAAIAQGYWPSQRRIARQCRLSGGAKRSASRTIRNTPGPRRPIELAGARTPWWSAQGPRGPIKVDSA